MDEICRPERGVILRAKESLNQFLFRITIGKEPRPARLHGLTISPRLVCNAGYGDDCIHQPCYYGSKFNGVFKTCIAWQCNRISLSEISIRSTNNRGHRGISIPASQSHQLLIMQAPNNNRLGQRCYAHFPSSAISPAPQHIVPNAYSVSRTGARCIWLLKMKS